MEEETVMALLGVTFLLVTGGVLLLRPIALRTGELVKVWIEEKRMTIRAHHHGGSQGLAGLEQLEDRMRRIEDRLEFTESLLTSPRRSHPDPRGTESSDARPLRSGGAPIRGLGGGRGEQ